MHRRGAGHVVSDFVDRAELIGGQGERQLGEERVDQPTVDNVADPRLLRRQRPLAGDQSDLHPQELVEHEPAVRGALFDHRIGTVDGPHRDGAADEIMPVEQRLVDGVGEPARRALGERLTDECSQLPGEDFRFARLRIDRQDHAGLVVGDAGAAEHIDDRHRHLSFAAVHVELAVQRYFGADRELFPARLG